MDSNIYTVTMLGLGGGSLLGVWLLFGLANDVIETATSGGHRIAIPLTSGMGI